MTFFVAIVVFSFAVRFIESTRCLNKCNFQGICLNSSFPSDLCPSLKLNDDINQQCMIKLTIDFSTGLANGSFDVETRSILTENKLLLGTSFSLNDNLVKLDIKYNCSVSDYCDLEFVRETLSPSLAALQIEPLRQTLAAHLYNPNNTDPIKCRSNDSCPQNTSFCFISYVHWGRSDNIHVNGGCQKLDDLPNVEWIQIYEPYGIKNGLTEIGSYFCNTENCGHNTTAIETFQMIAREYILPINISLINATTPPWSTKTTTVEPTTISTSEVTRQTSITNHASFLFGRFTSISIISFLIIQILLNYIY